MLNVGGKGVPLKSGPLAVVTGASSGIGRATAIELARAGYRTVLIARREPLLRELASELDELQPSIVLPMDLARTEEIEPRLGWLLAREGPASVIVNNAGFGVYAPFMEQSPDMQSRLMRVNHEAPLRITRAAMPGLIDIAARGGVAHVMNICSASARMGAWGHAGYAASKGAMRAATEALHCELAPRGIRVTAVYPGIIATPYFSQPGMDRLWAVVGHRAISAERMAHAIVRGIGRAGVGLYMPAHYRLLDLIAAISPRLAIHLVAKNSRPRVWASAAMETPADAPVAVAGTPAVVSRST